MQENQTLKVDASFTIPFERSNKKRARAIPGSPLKRAVTIVVQRAANQYWSALVTSPPLRVARA